MGIHDDPAKPGTHYLGIDAGVDAPFREPQALGATPEIATVFGGGDFELCAYHAWRAGEKG